jgi:hypothetical protein
LDVLSGHGLQLLHLLLVHLLDQGQLPHLFVASFNLLLAKFSQLVIGGGVRARELRLEVILALLHAVVELIVFYLDVDDILLLLDPLFILLAEFLLTGLRWILGPSKLVE